MPNPFEDAGARYVVMVNDDGQHSLWRDFIAVPAGWTVTFGPAGRQQCLDHIDSAWADRGSAGSAEPPPS